MQRIILCSNSRAKYSSCSANGMHPVVVSRGLFKGHVVRFCVQSSDLFPYEWCHDYVLVDEYGICNRFG